MAKQTPQPDAGAKRSGLTGFAVLLAAAAIAAYAIGFLVFFVSLPEAADPQGLKADAIIALTGEGDRLTPAVMLLEQGHGKRLLITGVNRAISKAHLKSLLHGGAAFDCCADLGFAAVDTRGNAEEAAHWMQAHHYRSAIVVTAAYHMPRSLIEFETAMPDTRFIPYPVPETRGDAWQALKRVGGEYTKYLASYVRASLDPFMRSRAI
jgi:uncharacterized SAM-binding protein YcdF (DUF218 family)